MKEYNKNDVIDKEGWIVRLEKLRRKNMKQAKEFDRNLELLLASLQYQFDVDLEELMKRIDE